MGSADRITELLVEKYGVDRDRITPDAALTDLGLDSLSLAELMFDIEDLFTIQVEPDDAEFKTLGEAVALVDRYIEAKEG